MKTLLTRLRATTRIEMHIHHLLAIRTFYDIARSFVVRALSSPFSPFLRRDCRNRINKSLRDRLAAETYVLYKKKFKLCTNSKQQHCRTVNRSSTEHRV